MPASRANAQENKSAESSNPQATRETVESIVVAVVLAFLFRAFVAEAFVIPTGSMAPTLQGRHLDLTCEQCGFNYRTGASVENDGRDLVKQGSCPMCRYTMTVQRERRWFKKTNRDSFNGDRILVSKFAYEVAEPKRWDVIVFKFPGNAKQNYIKRLIGLPGETLMIRSGDIFVARNDSGVPVRELPFEVARKPPHKVLAMLQMVDDTRYIGDQLRGVGWPSRWGKPTRWTDTSSADGPHDWKTGPRGQSFSVKAGDETSWLRYSHLVPWPDHWRTIKETEELPESVASGEYRGQLITDYYAYNDYHDYDRIEREIKRGMAGHWLPPGGWSGLDFKYGSAWVGDLSLCCEVEIESGSGEIVLDLIEGGISHQCRIDIKSGQASLTIDDGAQAFQDGPREVQQVKGATRIRGEGRHRLQFANVDDQLLLWVDSSLVPFEGPTTFVRHGEQTPRASDAAPGDLMPLGIGVRNASVRLARLQVMRDVYYQAATPNFNSEYFDDSELPKRDIFSDPGYWQSGEDDLFANRRSVFFTLGEDQYFPLGDNSPQSKDARLWSNSGSVESGYRNPPASVDRRLLLGKALLIYWPHAWRPLLPNFTRMGLIR